MTKEIELLIAKLDASSDQAAEKIIVRLTKIGKAALKSLIAAAKDESRPRIRKWSQQALGAIGDRRGAPILVAFKEERMTVKLHAIRGLARMGYRPAAPAIRRLLRDFSGGIRVNAPDALARLKELVKADDQKSVLASAREALAKLSK